MASSRAWYREAANTRMEVTHATYRCALPCTDAGGFERAGLGRAGVYSRRDRRPGWKRVRDDDLCAGQGQVLHARWNRKRTAGVSDAGGGGQWSRVVVW